MSKEFTRYANSGTEGSQRERPPYDDTPVTATERLVREEVEKLRENTEEIKKLKELVEKGTSTTDKSNEEKSKSSHKK